MSHEFDDWTPKEHEILALLAGGLSNAEIGLALGITARTVGIHVERIFRKLGASDRTQAVLRARALIASARETERRRSRPGRRCLGSELIRFTHVLRGTGHSLEEFGERSGKLKAWRCNCC